VAKAPPGKTPPVNDPIWHASGGKETIDSINNPDKKEKKQEDLRDVKPDVKLTAAELAATLSKNQDSLRGKVVEVTGVLDLYDFSSTGHGDFIVRSGPDKFPAGSGYVKLSCGEYPMAKATPGQTVTLRARDEPYIGLARWVIVKVEGDPAPTVTVEQLLADLKADRKAVEAKYGEKYIIVSGTIRKLDEKQYSLELTEPDASPRVDCALGSSGWRAAEASKQLEVGKPVRIVGKVFVITGVTITSGVILPPSP
jgi:hypothetical protein